MPPHVNTHEHMHACTHLCTHMPHVNTRAHAHTRAHMHTHAHTCTHTREHTCTHIHRYTCLHIYTHAHAHTHAHTHTHLGAHTDITSLHCSGRNTSLGIPENQHFQTSEEPGISHPLKGPPRGSAGAEGCREAQGASVWPQGPSVSWRCCRCESFVTSPSATPVGARPPLQEDARMSISIKRTLGRECAGNQVRDGD